MWSLRPLRLLQKLPHTARKTNRCFARSPIHCNGYNGYCSACEKPTAVFGKGKAEATANPPTPPADHRQLAVAQELFITSPYSPGSPLFLPNGTKIFNKLTEFLRKNYVNYGFDEVITPTIYKKSLWEKSGHWENYKNDMYAVTGRGATGEKGDRQVGQDEEYGLKPMNCPGHCLIFASKTRSYRDLPIRYADFSPLHRNEIHGALSGLTRVRRFHQDDGHIFCRPSQIGEEILKTLEFVKHTYCVLGLGPYRLTLSTRPTDNFIGEIEEWDNAEAALKKSLDESGQAWTINKGDGAFYGPKIDIILRDSDGKEHQTATIQLDFQLPKRFELEYQAPAPEMEQKGLNTNETALLEVSGPVTPVLIHRAVLGSVERIMALLIEHYNGKWPFWLNPRQVIIVTASSDQPAVLEFAQNTKKTLQAFGSKIAVDVDESARSIQKKVAEAKAKHYAIILVVGKREVESGFVTADLSGMKTDVPLVEDGIVKAMKWRQKRGGIEDGEAREVIPGQNGPKLGASIWDSPRSLLDTFKNAAALRPEDLKSIQFHPMLLRKFLDHKIREHVR